MNQLQERIDKTDGTLNSVVLNQVAIMKSLQFLEKLAEHNVLQTEFVVDKVQDIVDCDFVVVEEN